MSYITKDFLLTNSKAKLLYEKYGKNMPIMDYHCHLSEKEILENKRFNDIFEIWLKGDHYKWRLMRNYGVDEEYITGSKNNKEKFIKYCETLEKAFGNPLYHWSQLELSMYFNCELEINKKNAPKIWEEVNEFIKVNKVTPQYLIEKSNVKGIFTTNEMFDDLSTFKLIKNKYKSFKVAPAFRADKVMNIDAKDYLLTLQKLGKNITSLSDLEKVVEEKLKAFIEVDCVASDTALQAICKISDKKDADIVFKKRLAQKEISENDVSIFKGYFTYYLLKLYSKHHIRSEIHIGAMRNNNTVMLNKLGLDTGFDSIAEDNSIKNLSRLFDRLNEENSLPPCIIFNLNPKMNQEIMTLIGCFQDSSLKGKIQYGAAWWFLDNKDGMIKHLHDLTATGHLDAFIGMLTDSRSFLSYARHHYFRRILCSYLGELMENKEITNDIKIVGEVVQNICYNNVINYFKI